MTERIESLEQTLARTAARTRRWRLTATALAGGLGVAALIAATDATRLDSIQTHRIDIIDAEGRIVAAIGTGEQGGQIDLWSSAGANAIRLTAAEAGGDLAVWNNQGRTVAGVWASAHGGHLAAWSGDGATTASLQGAGGVLQLAGGPGRVEITGGDTQSIALLSEGGAAALTPTSVSLTRGEDALALSTDTPAVRLTSSGETTSLSAEALRFGGGAVAMLADGDRTRLQAGDTALTIGGDGLALSRGSQPILTAQSMDGEASLALSSPGGRAVLHASHTASLDLAGSDTESVSLASGAEAAILETSDQAVRVYADGGAGRVRLGSGESGGIRLTGGVDGMRPAVDVLGAGEVRVASLTTDRSGLGLLAVADTTGTPVGLLHGLQDGHGRLAISAPRGRAVATAAEDGTPAFTLQTADNRTTATLAATPRGGALNLMNADGTPVVLAGITSDGPGGAAAFQNGSGETVVAAGSTAENTGRIVVEPGPSPPPVSR
jgi:hypothetical protein